MVEIELNIMASPWVEDILEKDFSILTSLGCGAFGKVMLACNLPTHAKMTVKVLQKHHDALVHYQL